ncbi:MAG: alpha/beta fold hydrolase [Gemmatimonadaceae bacterium]|nr:alpha/beta fold hydrolase [Gemmatimonadaceae bacterium]
MNVSTRERVVRFGPADGLAGIVTTPKSPPPGSESLPHLVIVNAGIIHRVGPDRLYVDLARSMAKIGYPVLRFDLAGLGDSDAMRGGLSLEASADEDIGAAFDFLTATRGATRFVLIGLCSGANYSTLATFADPRVVGALLIDPSVSRTRRSMAVHIARRIRNFSTIRALLTLRHPVYHRGFDGLRSVAVAEAAAGQSGQRTDSEPGRAVSQVSAVTLMNTIIGRGVQLMMVFTGGVNHVYNYERQLFDLLPGVDFKDQLRLLYMPYTDHTVSDTASRSQLLEASTAWLRDVFPITPVAESSPTTGVGA